MGSIVEFPIKSYRDLRVWQLSKQLSVDVFKVTANFPDSELYGLTNQMRRAGVSFPSNIAEGNARSTKEFIRFINIALGSVAELETQIEIATELNFLPKATAEKLLKESLYITNMLGKLSHTLKQKSSNHKAQGTNHND